MKRDCIAINAKHGLDSRLDIVQFRVIAGTVRYSAVQYSTVVSDKEMMLFYQKQKTGKRNGNAERGDLFLTEVRMNMVRIRRNFHPIIATKIDSNASNSHPSRARSSDAPQVRRDSSIL